MAGINSEGARIEDRIGRLEDEIQTHTSKYIISTTLNSKGKQVTVTSEQQIEYLTIRGRVRGGILKDYRDLIDIILDETRQKARPSSTYDSVGKIYYSNGLRDITPRGKWKLRNRE
jgi:hypothetical protein